MFWRVYRSEWVSSSVVQDQNELQVSLVDEATGTVVFAPAAAPETCWTYLVETLVPADQPAVAVILLMLPIDGAEEAAPTAGADDKETVRRGYPEDTLEVLRLTQ
jgi:hypothetical protein